MAIRLCGTLRNSSGRLCHVRKYQHNLSGKRGTSCLLGFQDQQEIMTSVIQLAGQETCSPKVSKCKAGAKTRPKRVLRD